MGFRFRVIRPSAPFMRRNPFSPTITLNPKPETLTLNQGRTATACLDNLGEVMGGTSIKCRVSFQEADEENLQIGGGGERLTKITLQALSRRSTKSAKFWWAKQSWIVRSKDKFERMLDMSMRQSTRT